MSDQLDAATKLPEELNVPSLNPQADLLPTQPALKAAIAASLSHLFNSEEFKVLQEILDKWKSDANAGPEFYSTNPDMAKFDTGFRHCLNSFGVLKEDADKAVEFYAQSNGGSPEATSV